MKLSLPNIFVHSDFSLIPPLSNDFFTKPQKCVLHLHACMFCDNVCYYSTLSRPAEFLSGCLLEKYLDQLLTNMFMKIFLFPKCQQKEDQL